MYDIQTNYSNEVEYSGCNLNTNKLYSPLESDRIWVLNIENPNREDKYSFGESLTEISSSYYQKNLYINTKKFNGATSKDERRDSKVVDFIKMYIDECENQDSTCFGFDLVGDTKIILNKGSESISNNENQVKTDEQLFKELYDSFDAPDIVDFDAMGFIQDCEEIYKMSTKDFMQLYIEKEFEGNVDMQLWFHHAKLLGIDGENK